jgi:hypothetical protein
MKTAIYLSILFLCAVPYLYAESTDVSISESAQSALDDDFFSALQEVSEQTQEQPMSDAERAMDALAEAQMKEQQVAAQETSCIQKYAMAVAVKAILYYGACKVYLASWLHYFTACLFDE